MQPRYKPSQHYVVDEDEANIDITIMFVTMRDKDQAIRRYPVKCRVTIGRFHQRLKPLIDRGGNDEQL